MAHCSLRFFIDPIITAFAEDLVREYGLPTEQAILLPSHAVAVRCISFFHDQTPWLRRGQYLRIITLTPRTENKKPIIPNERVESPIVAVLFPRTCFPTAKTFWQHTGEGISSRRAEVFRKAFDKGHLMIEQKSSNSKISSAPEQTDGESASFLKPTQSPSDVTSQIRKGPQRYRKTSSQGESHTAPVPAATNGLSVETSAPDGKDHVQFVEERFGRNLDPKLGANAKYAIRRRIAGALISDLDPHETIDLAEATGRERGVTNFSVDDVYLYPSGMSSIFNTHRLLMKSRGMMKSICFGCVSLVCHKTLRG